MPQAIVDPDELERFTKELKQFNNRVEQMLRELTFRFNRVGDTWKDIEHQRFAEEFAQTSRMLHQFVVSSERHIPVLMKKAEYARAYLNQR